MFGPIKNVGIYVQDQLAAVEFYTEVLGFEMRRRIPMGANASWIEVAPPGAQTAFVLYPRAMMPGWENLKSSVVFHCPNIEETCQRLETHGVTITMRPTTMAWGTFAKFTDPDGNEFGMTSQGLA
jgi:lactoylglutathione lyase